MNRRVAGIFAHAVQIIRGWDYRAALRELEVSQWAPLEDVERQQRRKLRLLLEHCSRHVPFYRAEFDRLGMRAADIRDDVNLQALPIIDKRILRADYSQFLADDRARPHDIWKTSGSTGEPFAFRLQKSAVAANLYAALARGRRWWGIDVGDREAMVWSSTRDISDTFVGRLRARRRRISWALKNIRLIDTYNLDRDTVRAAYESLRVFSPVAMRSISSGLFRFCSLLRDLGLDGTALGIRHAIFTGESFPTAQRELVESVLACKTICEYGSSETGIIAFECPDGGLHLCHENLLFEYRKDGRAALPGEDAELLVTKLNDYAAPLVRYAIGDVVVPSDARCACGRTLPLISAVRGRAHAKIVTPSGGEVHGLFFTHLFDDLAVVHQFRVVQETIANLRIELWSTETIPQTSKDDIRCTVAKEMGEGVTVEVIQVAELPLSRSGKLQWIESRVETHPHTG